MKKIRNRRALAGLILAACVTLSIAYAGTGGAAPPTSGNTCVPDGKISGRGATFQTVAQQQWSIAFTRDVCGNVADPAAGNNMVLYNGYNPPSAAGAQLTGSGYGQKSASCRADAFAASDIPYDNATLKQLNDVPGSVPIGGATNNCNASAATATGFGTDYNPPFAPNNHTGNVYPAPGDQQAKIMSFPVTGSAEVVAVDLNGNDAAGTPICSSATKPTALTLTGAMINGLFGGTITHWNDPALIAGGRNAALTTDGCTGPVTRVVRLDKSGTTQIFKFYLEGVNQAGVLCDGTSTWGNDLALDAGNTTWPTGPNCSGLLRGDVNGNNGTFDVCSNKVQVAGQPTGGFVCYGDLADYQAFTGGATTIRSTVQAAVGTAFTSPVSGTAANCNFGVMSLPTLSSLGLNVDSTGTGVDTWALDNAGSIHGDIADQGTRYPICGVTYDLVYQGLGQGTLNGNNSAITGLNADQRRTLYSYELYILSSAGQNEMTKFFYGALPESVVAAVRNEFSSATGF